MSRELKICLAGAVLCHLLVLYGFHLTPTRPARLLHDSAVDVTLVAAPAASAPAAPETPAPAAPPQPSPPPPEPQPEIKPPEPLPVAPAEPEPVSQPTLPPPTPTTPAAVASPDKPVVSVPAAPAPAAGDSSAVPPGSDATSTTGQPEVQARAKYRHNPKPVYPLAARRRQQEGVVVLDVRVSATGRATEVAVAQSSGYPLLDEAALTAVRRWEFEPARQGETAVDSEILVPVRFRLTD